MIENPGRAKRARRRLRRELLALLRPRWRACFWAWPWGHEWPQTAWKSTDPDRCSRCLACGKPTRVEVFDHWELARLLDVVLGDDEPADALEAEKRFPALAAAYDEWREAGAVIQEASHVYLRLLRGQVSPDRYVAIVRRAVRMHVGVRRRERTIARRLARARACSKCEAMR